MKMIKEKKEKKKIANISFMAMAPIDIVETTEKLSSYFLFSSNSFSLFSQILVSLLFSILSTLSAIWSSK